MSTNFDVIIIGTGSGAQAISSPCKQAGMSVAVIDSRPFGGTCELRGCEPKKILVNAADLQDWSKRMQGKGISSPALSINWSDLIHFKRSFTEPVPQSIEQGFSKQGIASYHGRAHFVDAHTLQVGDQQLTGRYIAIASGARHAPLNIPGEEYLTTSTQFMEQEVLPPRILFVGGGYIAFEFSHASAHAGAQVQILHRGSQPLNKFDPALVDQLVQATTDLGVRVHTKAAVTAIERDGTLLHVHVQKGEQEEVFEAEMVVHAAGRISEIDDLHLEEVGIAHSKAGITVNKYLQSVSHPYIFAAGDAVNDGGWPLTPVSQMQGDVVAQNIVKGNHAVPDYRGIPSVVFTSPVLARVGLDEETARKQGLDFRVQHADTSEWYSSRRLALKHTGFKVLIDKQTDHILGAHILGSHAEDTINLFALAIRAGVKASELRKMIYTFPSASSDIPYMV